MKKLLISFFVSIFLSLPVLAASYPDVAIDHENFDAIEYLDEQNVINGYTDGTFGPDNTVTRAEAMKIILNALNVEIEMDLDSFFPDVKEDDWFFGGRADRRDGWEGRLDEIAVFPRALTASEVAKLTTQK